MSLRANFATGVLFFAGALSCLGQMAKPAKFDYARTLWRVSNGLPEDTVQAIAESADGVLWIGTSGGLAHFDGSHIATYGRGLQQPLAVNSIFTVAFGRDGTLWAGTEGGGLLRLSGGNLKVYANREGLTDGFVRSVAIDERGQVWAGTDDGLFVVEGEALRRVDGNERIPAMAVHSILHDREHRTWAGGSRLIDIEPDGKEREFALRGAYSQNRVKKILETRDGTIWVGTVGGLQRLEGERFETVPGIHATVRSLLETSDGTLWIGTIGDGLWTFADGQLTHVSSAGLLPSDTVLSIFEDGQQQIWIGTQAGLVRLDRTPVSVVPLPEGGDPDFETLSGDAAGNVWVSAQHLYLIRNGVARQTTYGALRNLNVRNVFRAHNGDLWIGTDGSGAYRVRPGSVTHYTAPQELTNNFIRGFLESRSGDIWIATDEGVSRIGSGAGTHQLTEANGLVFFSTRSLFEDRAGSIWIGTDRGLSRWSDGRFQHDAATAGLASEKVWSILEDRKGTMWFGTRDHGLFRFRGGQLQQFTTEQGLPSNSIYQILQDRQGTFWLSGPNTIASIQEASLTDAQPAPDHPLSVQVYDMPFAADGAQMYGGRQPAGFLAPDDSVWFATTRGAAHVAAAQAEAGPPPRASLDDLQEDGRSVAFSDGFEVPSRVARLSFSFTALSLRPQKGVRFRYKLENFDQNWNLATTDRIATYTNLPAGRYRFRVVAFDTARPSELSELNLEFTKLPYFYQSWWFLPLCLLALTALAWTIYEVRVRQIRTRFSAVLAERNRLAREMHDTVIQGCTGISALLEAMASTPGQAGGELLEYARVQARTTIDEARHAVWNMRHEENDVDLIESLSGVALQTTREFGTRVAFEHDVERLTVGASTAHEILMTVREAVYNSVQHSGTKDAQLDVAMRGTDIAISISDEGCGLAQKTSDAPQDGHYGIIGMRERMQRIGGHIELISKPGLGTRVQLSIPRVTRATRGEGA